MANRGTVPAAAITYASFALPISMLGVVWPEVRAEYGQSLGTLGVVSLIYGVARMALATSGRSLVTIVGTGRAFVIALALLALSCSLLAASPSWPIFLVAIGCIGLTSGLIDSIGAVFIATLGEVGSAGLIHGFYGFGATVGPLVVAVLPGWRWPIVAAIAGVGLALASAVVVRDRWPTVETRASSSADVEVASAPPRAVIAVSLVLFATFVAVEVTAGQWVFTYLTDGRGLGDGRAAVAVSAFWAGLMAGRLLMAGAVVGRIIERLGLGALAGTAGAAVIAVIALPPTIAMVPLVVAGMALAPIIPTLFATTALRVGNQRAASIAGWQLVATNFGAISLPTVTGVLVDTSGPSVVVIVVIVTLGLVGAPLLLTLDRMTTP